MNPHHASVNGGGRAAKLETSLFSSDEMIGRQLTIPSPPDPPISSPRRAEIHVSLWGGPRLES